MFTGIVEEVGEIRAVRPGAAGKTFTISARTVLAGAKPGDSIMVNGCCLTITRFAGDGGFDADISPETLRVTTLGQMKPGGRVNLERALALGDRLGGHLVSGHVDAVGKVRRIQPTGEATLVWFDVPASVRSLCVPKGSIAVDGISLTINELDTQGLAVMIIPHTAGHTTLLDVPAGGPVNLEADLIGKYVARLAEAYRDGGGGMTMELLAKL